MNNETKKMIGIVMLLSAVLICGQGLFASGAPEKGFGDTVEVSFNNAGFNSVVITGIDDYEIVLGDDYAVSVRADESLINRIEVRQTGSALSVSLPEAYKYAPQTLSAVIELPALDALTIAAKSHGTITGATGTGSAIINVTDGSTLAMSGLSVNKAQVEVSVDSDLTGSIDADSLDLRVYSSAVSLSGEAEIFSCFADAGDIEMKDLYVNTALLNFNEATEGTCELKESESVETRAYTEIRLHDASELNISAEGDVNDDNVDDDSALYYI